MTTSSSATSQATDSAAGAIQPVDPATAVQPVDAAVVGEPTARGGDGSHPVGTRGGSGAGAPDDPVVGRVPETGGWEAIAAYARGLGPDPACVGLSDAQVEAELRRSAGAVASATARFLVLVGEFVVRGIWAEAEMTTPGQWLSWAVGLAPSTGREMVRVALALRTFTKVRERLLAGTISYSKARAITRVGEPALEDTLLTYADHAPASQLERVVRTFRGLDTAESAHDRRGATVRHDAAGETALRARMPRDVGLRMDTLLERLVQSLDETGQPHDGDLDDERERLDDAAPLDRDSIAARRLDALVHGLEVAVDHLDGDLTGADRTTLVLHGEVDTVIDRLAGTTAPVSPDTTGDPPTLDDTHPASGDRPDGQIVDAEATGPGGDATSAEAPPARPTGGGGGRCGGGSSGVVVTDQDGGMLALSRAVLRRLSCDPSIVRITTRDGLPIDVGRQTRQISLALRRALRARDGTCRYPGCAATRHLHAHHVVHWANGGPTDLANLVLLCGAHHRLVHAHDLVVDHDPDRGHTTIRRTADTPPIPSVLDPVGTTPAASAEAATRHDPVGLQPPGWWGDRLDLDTAVAHLQHQIGRIPGLLHAA